MMIRYLERLRKIDQLIYSKRTGNSAQFSKKLGISRSTLFEYLNEMRSLDAPIRYSRKEKTYYYTSNGSFKLSFGEKIA